MTPGTHWTTSAAASYMAGLKTTPFSATCLAWAVTSTLMFLVSGSLVMAARTYAARLRSRLRHSSLCCSITRRTGTSTRAMIRTLSA